MSSIFEPYIDRYLSPSDQPKGTLLRWVLAIVASSILTLVLLAIIAIALSFAGPAIGIDLSVYFPEDMSDQNWNTVSDAMAFGVLALYVPAFILAVRIADVKFADLVNPWRTGISYRRIGVAIALTIGIYVIALVPSFFLKDSIGFRPWTTSALWTALGYGFLILFQASGEELLCRGALIHLIGKITRNFWVLLFIPTYVFWAMHGQNIEHEFVDPIFLNGFYILMGLVLGALVLLTGRLEYSMGLHIGNNLFAATMMDNISNPELSNGIGFITVNTGPTSIDLVLNAFTVIALAYFLLRYDRALKAKEEH